MISYICISYTVFVYCLLGSFSSSVILQRRPSHFTSFQVEFQNGDQHEKALRIDVLGKDVEPLKTCAL